jgi:phosphotransferase family enzyme
MGPPPPEVSLDAGTVARLVAAQFPDLVRPLLAPALRDRAAPYLSGTVPPPAPDKPGRLIHNDICPDHLIVDPATGRLTGLIDFTDAVVGPPVLDFVGLIGLGGYAFIGQVAAHYDLPTPAGFGDQLRWLARTLTLRWLAEAAADSPADIPRHQGWVAAAFGS